MSYYIKYVDKFDSYFFKWQELDDCFYLLHLEANLILAKVWFDEHDKRVKKGWYFIDEFGNAPKDEDENYEDFSSLEEAKEQAQFWVVNHRD
jgi:hypothetical protein